MSTTAITPSGVAATPFQASRTGVSRRWHSSMAATSLRRLACVRRMHT